MKCKATAKKIFKDSNYPKTLRIAMSKCAKDKGSKVAKKSPIKAMNIKCKNVRSQPAKKNETPKKNKKIAKDSKISKKLKDTIDFLTNAGNKSGTTKSVPISSRNYTVHLQRLKNYDSISQPIDDLHFSSLTPNKGSIKKSEFQLRSHSSLSKENITSKVKEQDKHKTRNISVTRKSIREFTSPKKSLTEPINTRRSSLRNISEKLKKTSIKNKSTPKKTVKGSNNSHRLQKANIDDLQNSVGKSISSENVSITSTRRCKISLEGLKRGLYSISRPIDDFHISSLTPNEGGIKMPELRPRSRSSILKNSTPDIKEQGSPQTRKTSAIRKRKSEFTTPEKSSKVTMNPRRSTLKSQSDKIKNTPIKCNSPTSKIVKGSDLSTKLLKTSSKSEMNPRRNSLRNQSKKIKDTPIKSKSPTSKIVKGSGSKLSTKSLKTTLDDLKNSGEKSVKIANAPNKSCISFKTKNLESSSSQAIDDLHCISGTPNKGRIQELTKLVLDVSYSPNASEDNIRSKRQRKCRTKSVPAGSEREQNKGQVKNSTDAERSSLQKESISPEQKKDRSRRRKIHSARKCKQNESTSPKAPEKINRAVLSRTAKNKIPSHKSSESKEINITDHINTRLAKKQNLESTKKNNTRNKVVKGVNSKLLRNNNVLLQKKNMDSLVDYKTVQCSPRLSKKNIATFLPLTTPKRSIEGNDKGISKPTLTTDEKISDKALHTSKQTSGKNVKGSSNTTSNEDNDLDSIFKIAERNSKSVSKTSRKRKCERRHTVPIFKNSKRKKVETRKVTTTALHSPKCVALSQNSSPIGHFNTLSNIPLDDITLASVITPNSFDRNFGRKKVLATSTPCPNTQSTKGKKRKLSKNNLLNGSNVPKKPSRGTLKQKRWIINTLKERNEGYEDDLFESNKFDGFEDMAQIDDDSDSSLLSIETPKCAFLITPNPPSKTPRYKDCYSPMEWLKTRKLAEEVMHRRKQKRKSDTTSNATSSHNVDSTLETSDNLPEKKRLEFMSLIKNLPKPPEELEEDHSEKDDYFSDVST